MTYLFTKYPNCLPIGYGKETNTFYCLYNHHKVIKKKDDLFFRTSVDNVLYGKAFGKLFEEDGLKSLFFCSIPLDSLPIRSYPLLMARLFLGKIKKEILSGSL